MKPFDFKSSEKFSKAGEKIKNIFSELPKSKVADDISKLTASAASVALNVKKDMETKFRDMMEGYIAKGNLVSREEFEVVKEMAATARKEADELKKRLDKLEGKTSATKETNKKPASKKAKK